MKMALVIKLTFLRPSFKSDDLEAQKACFLVTWIELNLAFSANDQCQFNINITFSRMMTITNQYNLVMVLQS